MTIFVTPVDDEPGEIAILDADEDVIASILSMGSDWQMALLDARRIVACVNGCEGNTTEEMELAAIPGGLTLTVDEVLQDAVTAMAEAADLKGLIADFLNAWDAKVNKPLAVTGWVTADRRLNAALLALREVLAP